MKQTIKQFTITAMSLFVALAAFAQVTTSTMSGRITEANGTPIVGATIVAVHTPSGSQYYSITDNSGNYRIQNMRVGGPYSVEVQFLGFGSMKQGNITLRLGENYVHNAQLTEQAVSLNEVVITAGVVNPILNSDRTGASLNISTREINSLPSISRSITDFTKMTPQANGTSFAGRDGRFNTVTIDGAAFNNNFGLSSNALPGGSAQPISLDAIAEVSVNIAPYDVRSSQFTGASINAVTKSGDNSLRASVYAYIRPKTFTGERVGDLIVPKARERSSQIYGATIGGPIIKNKLFLFVSGEYEKEVTPTDSWEPSTNGVANADLKISRTTVADLERAKKHLLSTYNYDPGDYQNFASSPSNNYKILARLDWNIARNHKFSFRYNMLRNNSSTVTTNGNSGPPNIPRSNYMRVSETAISFSNSFYGNLNSIDAFSAELNSTFGSRISNKLLVSYTATTDPQRTSTSDIFPFVDIYKDGNPYMSFGYELFTFKNQVENNTSSIVDNLTISLDKHTLTAGLAYDNIYVNNSYIREGTSYYRYASLDDFINNAKPTGFGVTYGYDGQPIKGVQMSFGLASAYLQDEWQVNKDFKVTYGVRAELPLYHNALKNNPAIGALDFNGYKMNVGEWPNSKLQINPRFGFNWDAKGDRSLQIRGGTGLFSGVLPFVWFTNQPSSSGTIQSPEMGITGTNLPADFRFNKDYMAQIAKYPTLFPSTMSATLASGAALAEVAKDFKMPRVWRSNLAADIELPGNMILTLEALYTKDINAIVQKNINLPAANRVFSGVDKRAYWSGNKVLSTVGSAMVLSNSDKGFQSSFTAQLTKNFSYGLSGMLAYTFNHSKDLSANPGSSAYSAWQANLDAFNINTPQLSYSSFANPHRVIGSLSYRIEYLRHLATTFSVYYNGASQGRSSVAYSNDMTGDGVAGDLIYIPCDKYQLAFVDVVTGGVVKMTAAQQADKFMEYVNNDSYLSKHKGEYAERYGVVNPWKNRWDVKVLQDIFAKFGSDRRYTLQLTLDIVNAGNLLSKNWGLYTRTGLANQYNVIMPLTYKGVNAGGQPTFTLNAADLANFDDKNRQVNALSTSSTWGMQFGIRLMF